MQAPVRTTGQAGSGSGKGYPKVRARSGPTDGRAQHRAADMLEKSGSGLRDRLCHSQPSFSTPAAGPPTDDRVIFCPQGSGSVALREMGTGGSQMPQCGRPMAEEMPFITQLNSDKFPPMLHCGAHPSLITHCRKSCKNATRWKLYPCH